MKLGITCVSQGVLQIPKILSTPTTSSSANNISAISNGFHAPKYFLFADASSNPRASMPAIMLRRTAVMLAIPYTQS